MNETHHDNASYRKHIILSGTLFVILCVMLYFLFFQETNIKGTLENMSTESAEATGASADSSTPNAGEKQEGSKGSAQKVAKNPNPVDLHSATNPVALFVQPTGKGRSTGNGVSKPPPAPVLTNVFSNRGIAGRARARANGATQAVFDAIDLGLEWLAKNQESDGHWNAGKWGGGRHDLGCTGLALLAFLGNGNSHKDGKYRANVRRAMDWLASRQQDNGNLGWTTFYEQGIAAMAICEDVALTPYDNRYRNVSAKAVGHILTQMGRNGGFGYKGPGRDTSVTGWQIMAIKSAYIAKIYPQFPRVKSILNYLNISYNPNGSTGYQGRSSPNNTMTAVGMFCRIFLNYKKTHPEIRKSASLIVKSGPNVRNEYYTYYATYCMFQMGGKVWEDWNNGFRDPLIALQEKSGENRGSWGKGKHSTGGRVYFTAINIMSLEVYQRYLPVYW